MVGVLALLQNEHVLPRMQTHMACGAKSGSLAGTLSNWTANFNFTSRCRQEIDIVLVARGFLRTSTEQAGPNVVRCNVSNDEKESIFSGTTFWIPRESIKKEREP